jgi:hypothetical protein
MEFSFAVQSLASSSPDQCQADCPAFNCQEPRLGVPDFTLAPLGIIANVEARMTFRDGLETSRGSGVRRGLLNAPQHEAPEMASIYQEVA